MKTDSPPNASSTESKQMQTGKHRMVAMLLVVMGVFGQLLGGATVERDHTAGNIVTSIGILLVAAGLLVLANRASRDAH